MSQPVGSEVVDDESLVAVLVDAAGAVARSLDGLEDWGLAGTRPWQYRSDLAADDAALAVLHHAGLAVLSEESGLTGPEHPILVVLDPVDGSTNAARGVPWFATSLCALDADGPRAAVVVNQASGDRYDAVRGCGARRNGAPLRPSPATEVGESMLALSGYPPRHLGWRQYRALGASALDLCAVASGVVDGFVDCSRDAHGPWDYMGGLLVCTEAGASVIDADGRDLVVREHAARRTPLAAGTPELLAALRARRAGMLGGSLKTGEEIS